jgi:large subunit ribosomal protein L29
MKSKDIKGLSVAELNDKIAAESEALNRMKFGHAITPIENPMKIRNSRKLVARLNTELRAKTGK